MNARAFLLLLLSLLLHADLQSQWTQVGQFGNMSCSSIIDCDSILFASLDNGIHRSTNNGINWSLTYNTGVRTLASNDSIVFAGNYYGVHRTTNNGINWTQTSLNYAFVWAMAVNGPFVYAGTVNPEESRGVYRSTDNGETWNITSLHNVQIQGLVTSGPFVVACGGNPGNVYVSSDYGLSWMQTLPYSVSNIECLAIEDSVVYAGGSAQVFVSTNYGFNWSNTSMQSLSPLSILIREADVFVGTNYGLFQSTNLGLTWIQRNEGLENLPYQYIESIVFVNNYSFVGTFLYSIWRRPLSELIGINTISSYIPDKFSLSQNYPNPFNPFTNITFEIPLLRGVSEGRGVLTKLIIYDLLGREIIKLVDKQLQPGTYSVDWDASNYPSGVYFYRFVSGDYSESKKMMLIK